MSYILDGKKLNLSSDEWTEVYSDGNWSSRGVKLYYRESDETLVLEEWSNWQGEVNTAKIVTEEEAKEFLLKERHQDRVLEAIETLGIGIDDY